MHDHVTSAPLAFHSGQACPPGSRESGYAERLFLPKTDVC